MCDIFDFFENLCYNKDSKENNHLKALQEVVSMNKATAVMLVAIAIGLFTNPDTFGPLALIGALIYGVSKYDFSHRDE